MQAAMNIQWILIDYLHSNSSSILITQIACHCLKQCETIQLTGKHHSNPLHSNPLHSNPLHSNPLHSNPFKLERIQID